MKSKSLDDGYFEQLGVANAILNWKKVVAKYKQKASTLYVIESLAASQTDIWLLLL
jgi:hypothetical protein